MSSNDNDAGRGGQSVDFGPSLQRYLAGDDHALDDLPERERELALTLAPAFEPEPDTTDLDEGAPPRALDPIAIALGLVPGPDDVLSGKRLQSARQRAKLNLGQLVERLQQRGWDLNGQQVLAWHSTNTTVAPALINAVADTLGVPARTLRGAAPRYTTARASDFLDDAVIERYLRDWAGEIGHDPASVRDRARRTLASLNFRNQEDISRDDVIAILRALRRIDPDGTSS